MAEPRRRPGRPRDASISERALAATRELLVQRGFDATTIQAVAEHSGVHASAIYRRWPSRIELIEEATFPGLNPLSVQPTGDLRRDLRRFIRAYLAAFSAPAARAAAAGLFAHYQTSSHLRPPELYLRVSARPQFQDILRAAPPGSIDPAVDPDDVFDMLLGAVLTRTLLFAVTARRRPIERTVEMILRLLRPSDRSLDRPCDDRHWPPRLPAWRRLDGGSGGRRLGLGQLEEVSCQEYTEFLTQWASSSMGFETTVRRVSELPGLVYLEIEERHTRAGNIAVVNSLSVYEFNEAGQIRHLDVYLQQPR